MPAANHFDGRPGVRYMLLIYAKDEADPASDAAPVSPPWVAYTEWLAERGILRGGDRLASTAAATTVRVDGGRTLVTDGPYAETREVLGGYYIVECDLDTALEAAGRCPGAAIGPIEVRPIIDMAPPA